jgi:ubiquilin
MRAAEGRNDGNVSANATDNPFAAMFAANPLPGREGHTTTTAMPTNSGVPDPWTPNAGGHFSNTVVHPFEAATGGAPGGIPGTAHLHSDQMMSQMERMLSDPAMRAMMQSMMSNPDVISQMFDTDPTLRAMAEAHPGFRETLRNPEVLRQMSDPDTMRTNMRMMQQMQRMGGMGGLMGGLMGDPSGTNGVSPGAGGFGAPSVGGQNTSIPSAELYATQLQQMKDMGFFDEAQNIWVLQQCMGNVSAAIERLLTGP